MAKDNLFDMSVIVVTYNSSFEELKKTLKSILIQRDVSVQIIICDDGSIENNENKIIDFFTCANYNDYVLVMNEINEGTVRNIRSGLAFVKSEIVKILSPKDYLYDYNTLNKIVKIFKNNEIDILEADGVYYNNDSNNIKVLNLANPQKEINKSGLLNKNKVLKQLIKYKDWFLGATTFYKTKLFCNLIDELIVAKIVYCEDLSSGLVAVKKGNIYYLKENVVWYNYGSGISTKKDEFSSSIMKNDEAEFFIHYLPHRYKSYVVNQAKKLTMRLREKNRIIRKTKVMLFHGYYYFYYKIKHSMKRKIEIMDFDCLNEILSNEA